MSLDLKDIERGVGADLLRRPMVTSVVNAFLLRFYYDTIFEWPEPDEQYHDDTDDDTDDEDDDDDHHAHHIENGINSTNVTGGGGTATTPRPPPSTPKQMTVTDAENAQKHAARQSMVEHIAASFIFLLTHLLLIVGVAETVMWIVFAIVFKLLSFPRIYAFEKLLLDVRSLVLPQTVRYIDKNIRLKSDVHEPLPQLVAMRRGLSCMPLIIITPAETLTRETASMLRLFRYFNRVTVGYWTDDALVLAGRNVDIVEALTNLNTRPVHVDLGWHKDVIEATVYKLSITFTRESSTAVKAMPPESPVRDVGARVIVVQMEVEANTHNLELLLISLDQYAAVCEAAEKGLRHFNGKRFSIYGIGILAALLLVAHYTDGDESTWERPSIDVLTLALGAYTLWMTIGKSAALGETEEETIFDVTTRENILLAFHGLATVEENVVNTCWVPEVYREQRPEPARDAVLEDGSISLLEAAVYLNIYLHYGHLIKWKGPRLVLDRYKIIEEEDCSLGVGHILAVQRVSNINLLEYEGESASLRRIGGGSRRGCRHTCFR